MQNNSIEFLSKKRLKFLNLKKIEKILDTTGIFVIIIPMFFNVKEVDIYEDDIPT